MPWQALQFWLNPVYRIIILAIAQESTIQNVCSKIDWVYRVYQYTTGIHWVYHRYLGIWDDLRPGEEWIWPSAWRAAVGLHAGNLRTSLLLLLNWLVVEPPLWKIWKSVGKDYPIYYGKIKNVPNHQPVKLGCPKMSEEYPKGVPVYKALHIDAISPHITTLSHHFLLPRLLLGN